MRKTDKHDYLKEINTSLKILADFVIKNKNSVDSLICVLAIIACALIVAITKM